MLTQTHRLPHFFAIFVNASDEWHIMLFKASWLLPTRDIVVAIIATQSCMNMYEMIFV